MTKIVALTTVDNPYDPIDQFGEWFTYDMDHGYNSCGLLARLAHTSDEFTDEENVAEIERAIDDFIKVDFLNLYKKVVKFEENVERNYKI